MTFGFRGVYLIHQTSDKRLLNRYGNGNGYLNETRSGSYKPQGMRIGRAGARKKAA